MRQVAERKGFTIVGAVDIDPAKAGRDLGEVAGRRPPLRVKVSADVEEGDQGDEAGRRRAVHELVAEEGRCRRWRRSSSCKVPIVSTTEELAYPTRANLQVRARHPRSSAKKAKVAVLGTGVNPGFVMDALPITLTGVCERVEAVRIDRVQDARIRRLPFQQKIGAGLTREQFQKKVDDGSVRHVGLAESVSMIADAMGWKLDRHHRRDPAEDRDRDGGERVPRGRPGLRLRHRAGRRRLPQRRAAHHAAHGGVSRRAGVVSTRSRSPGSPALKMKIAGGVHGDIATASIVVNSLPKILEVAPGLHTMRDMPLPSFYGGWQRR